MIKRPAHIGTIQHDSVTPRKGKEPREDKEKNRVPGAVLLAVRELVWAVSSDTLKAWEEERPKESFNYL